MRQLEKALRSMLWLVVLLTGMVHAETGGAEISSYRLGSGDLIRIQVYGEDDLTLEARITDSGTISYPFLGQIQVAGLTLTQLQQHIVTGLDGDYLVDPKVSVSILGYRQFYVNGEVKKPGGFPYEPGLTIRKAISLAGGLTERASTKKMSVIPEGSQHQQQTVDMNTRVNPGDIITIEQSFF